MTIRVRLFALLRDRAGAGEAELSLPGGATVAAAAAALADRFPGLRDAVPRVMYAVNQEYAAADAVLKDGDELALIPPVSGG
ncbi:MAG: mocA [Phycisphaerales bacterium]|nr:mocA [Phycisphaerales bacterium]